MTEDMIIRVLDEEGQEEWLVKVEVARTIIRPGNYSSVAETPDEYLNSYQYVLHKIIWVEYDTDEHYEYYEDSEVPDFLYDLVEQAVEDL